MIPKFEYTRMTGKLSCIILLIMVMVVVVMAGWYQLVVIEIMKIVALVNLTFNGDT